ncbi:MAG TPA: hypothetical protein VIN65_09385 [Candidatus Dormibacteraeota bacterium]
MPEWAQKIIADTRTEAATYRTGKTAAETERDTSKAILDAINAAANPGAAPVDPAKLADQLTAAGQAKTVAEVQLAVFKAATTAGVNANSLLNRVDFTTTVKGLDPAAADFATQVEAAITTAVTADPSLKSGPVVPGKSGGEVIGGGTQKQSDDPQQRARDYYDAAATK